MPYNKHTFTVADLDYWDILVSDTYLFFIEVVESKIKEYEIVYTAALLEADWSEDQLVAEYAVANAIVHKFLDKWYK